jgi:hypothetical protein
LPKDATTTGVGEREHRGIKALVAQYVDRLKLRVLVAMIVDPRQAFEDRVGAGVALGVEDLDRGHARAPVDAGDAQADGAGDVRAEIVTVPRIVVVVVGVIAVARLAARAHGPHVVFQVGRRE